MFEGSPRRCPEGSALHPWPHICAPDSQAVCFSSSAFLTQACWVHPAQSCAILVQGGPFPNRRELEARPSAWIGGSELSLQSEGSLPPLLLALDAEQPCLLADCTREPSKEAEGHLASLTARPEQAAWGPGTSSTLKPNGPRLESQPTATQLRDLSKLHTLSEFPTARWGSTTAS